MPDLVCLSHLRWQFVYQRPQHLLTRAARTRRVFYVEEPEVTDGPPGLRIRPHATLPLFVVTPLIVADSDDWSLEMAQRDCLSDLWRDWRIDAEVLWFYTPMAVGFGGHLPARVVVYDCMDELSQFDGASPLLKQRERELLTLADVVFTGGASLYESKRSLHSNVHLFPSSVDVQHFGTARALGPDPIDQSGIPHPRLGYFGVIDERLDLGLIAAIAEQRPDFQVILVGPTAKIAESDLPRRPNIHYLGFKAYEELPSYLRGWDVGIMPFARNAATQFISPTKTPEYLAAGLPVVSTAIHDVVRDYGNAGLVAIANDSSTFIEAAGRALVEDGSLRLRRVDAALHGRSWDSTWEAMESRIQSVQHRPSRPPERQTAPSKGAIGTNS